MSFEETPEEHQQWVEDIQNGKKSINDIRIEAGFPPVNGELRTDCGKSSSHPPHLFEKHNGRKKSCSGRLYYKHKAT